MKRFILFALVCFVCSTTLPVATSAQDSTVLYPNYVVIGAFAILENAVEFNDEANKNKFLAKFEMNPNRNLYYVYVLTTDDRAFAFEEARKLRTTTKYFDTWVYAGPLGENRGQIVYRPGASQDFNPETGAELHAVNVRSDGNIRMTEKSQPVISSPPHTLNATASPQQQTNAGRKKKKGNDGDAVKAANETSVQETQIHPDSDSVSTSVSNHDDGVSTPGTISPIRNDNQNEQPEKRAGLSGSQKSDSTVPQRSQEAGNVHSTNDNKTSVESNRESRTQQKQTDALTSTAEVSAQKQNTPNSDAAPGTATADDVGKNPVAHNGANINTNGLTETGKKAIAENIEKVATLGPPPARATTQPLTKEEVTGRDFYFYLFRGDNLATVDGEVDAIDFEKARRMATYQGNTPVKVIMPSGKSTQISFVCQVFGYRKQQREYDPNTPPDDFYLDKKGNLVVPFELSRLQKGDIAIMYNVFFFKDAAVMRPESRFEVNNLLEFLVENPSYKIMIHGHTNGNATGKIIRMDTPGNFYTLSGTKQGFGSAKQLSEERAIVIREFLIASGISPDRMDIRAWGGKKPIHDKHSVRANENVRVEIEILSQ